MAYGNKPEGMTQRELRTLAGMADKIPDNHVDIEYHYLIEWFWDLRSYVADNYTPLTPDCVPKWLPDKYPSRVECDIILAMDLAFRKGMAATVAANEQKRRDK